MPIVAGLYPYQSNSCDPAEVIFSNLSPTPCIQIAALSRAAKSHMSDSAVGNLPAVLVNEELYL